MSRKSYNKREIYRIMSWGSDIGNDFKFVWLRKQFAQYFGVKLSKREKKETGSY